MKNVKIKYLIALFFIFISTTLCACSNSDRLYQTNIKEDDIAYITLFSFSGEDEAKYGLMNLGHAFLSIENISDKDIEIYNYIIPSGESISLGSWSLSKHLGVWINIESNYIQLDNKYKGRYSITTGINESDLEILNNTIAKKDKWGLLKNCSYFAYTIWNSIAEDNEKINKPNFLYTPTYLEEEIRKFDNFEVNRPIKSNSNCYYFNGENYVEFKMTRGE